MKCAGNRGIFPKTPEEWKAAVVVADFMLRVNAKNPRPGFAADEWLAVLERGKALGYKPLDWRRREDL